MKFMARSQSDQPALDVTRQLERMLQSREMVTQPRIARMLRFFVEESVRNGFEPINQRLIATHALGLEEGFNPSQSAYVRVNMARLRRAVEKYFTRYRGVDPLAFEITTGPYRLVVLETNNAGDGHATRAAVDARRHRPLLLLVEPLLSGDLAGKADVARKIGLRVASQLLDSSLVTVSGPLLRERFDRQTLSLPELAASLGYEFTADSELGVADGEWTARLMVTDAILDQPVDDATSSLGRFSESDAAADAVSTWLLHRIGDCFATRVRPDATS